MPSSKSRTKKRFGIAGLILLAFFSLDASAAADKDPAVKAAKEQARRLQEQKRTLEVEKNQLLLEKTEITRKLEIAESEAGKKKVIERSLRETQQRLNGSIDDAKKLQSELVELKNQISELNNQLGVEKDGRSRVEKELESCSVKNDALYARGRKLIQSFERGGTCDATAGEPFIGLGSVATENTLETARDELDAQRYREPQQNK